jgi:hypothetical protein
MTQILEEPTVSRARRIARSQRRSDLRNYMPGAQGNSLSFSIDRAVRSDSLSVCQYRLTLLGSARLRLFPRACVQARGETVAWSAAAYCEHRKYLKF